MSSRLRGNDGGAVSVVREGDEYGLILAVDRDCPDFCLPGVS